jgi:GNAT superfamily N-acetyltransferase
MSDLKGDKPEQPPETQDRHEGEAKLRQLERSMSGEGNRPPDHSFSDEKGRLITIKNSETNDMLYAEARDTTNGPGERVGTLTASLERQGENPRLRIHMVEAVPSHRGAGIAGELIRRAEDYGQRNGAREIYGAVTDAEARSFWEQQADQGWKLVNNGTEVHKQL